MSEGDKRQTQLSCLCLREIILQLTIAKAIYSRGDKYKAIPVKAVCV